MCIDLFLFLVGGHLQVAVVVDEQLWRNCAVAAGASVGGCKQSVDRVLLS
jgi:hypothetical protein